jgi:hypothetical protein
MTNLTLQVEINVWDPADGLSRPSRSSHSVSNTFRFEERDCSSMVFSFFAPGYYPELSRRWGITRDTPYATDGRKELILTNLCIVMERHEHPTCLRRNSSHLYQEVNGRTSIVDFTTDEPMDNDAVTTNLTDRTTWPTNGFYADFHEERKKFARLRMCNPADGFLRASISGAG